MAAELPEAFDKTGPQVPKRRPAAEVGIPPPDQPEAFDKTGPHVPKRRMDRELADLAVRQHGVVSLDQLRQLGLTDSGVRKRSRAGRLHRIHRGVYAIVPRALLRREGLWMAAVLACGPGAVLSHRSAAALQELRPAGVTHVEVTIARRTRRKPGLRIHTSRTLTRADITTVNGIPCTTVARTLLDVAGALNRRQLERTCDQAEILEVFDLAAVSDQIARHPTRKGARALKAIITEHYIGDTPTWYDLEEAFLGLTRAIGLPDPECNAWIDPGDGEPSIRVDFVWRARRLVVEADSKRFHLTQQAFEHDRRRDQRLTAARWRPLRTTWRQIRYAPAELERTLQTVY